MAVKNRKFRIAELGFVFFLESCLRRIYSSQKDPKVPMKNSRIEMQ